MVAQHIWLLADCGDCMYRPVKQISLVLYRNPAVLAHVPWHILHWSVMTIATENTRRFEGPVIEAEEEKPGLRAHSDQYQAMHSAENCLVTGGILQTF